MGKATFQVSDQILLQAKEAVAKGYAKSLSNLVEISLKDTLQRIKEEQIRIALKKASEDPLYLADIEEISKDFEYLDYEEESK